jgi:kynureninase
MEEELQPFDMTTFSNTLDCATALDQQDPLRSYRDAFLHPVENNRDRTYFLGNSLGLQPKNTMEAIQHVLEQWQQDGVESFFKGKDNWLAYHDKLTGPLAIITGAMPHEITVMNQLTVNIHLMMVSFYQPKGDRRKILMESKAFPSDQYAIASFVRHMGLNPDEVIVEINPDQEGIPPTNEQVIDAIHKHGEEIALVFLSGVNYYTGQLFDLSSIAMAAKKVGALVGFDLAHAVGNVSMNLHDWDIDFACWCSYKYLNAGPGAIAGAFIHEKHHQKEINRLEGWWGVKLNERFLMRKNFISSGTATAWQLSTSPMLLFACLHASLSIIEKAGWSNMLNKQRKMIAWTDFLLTTISSNVFKRITPHQRGCQISMQFPRNGKEVYNCLFEKGFMIDWREPDVIRFAPVPLYNSFTEIWQFFNALREITNELPLND